MVSWDIIIRCKGSVFQAEQKCDYKTVGSKIEQIGWKKSSFNWDDVLRLLFDL